MLDDVWMFISVAIVQLNAHTLRTFTLASHTHNLKLENSLEFTHFLTAKFHLTQYLLGFYDFCKYILRFRKRDSYPPSNIKYSSMPGRYCTLSSFFVLLAMCVMFLTRRPKAENARFIPEEIA